MGSLGVLKISPCQCSRQVGTCTWIWCPLGGPGVDTHKLTQEWICLHWSCLCTRGHCEITYAEGKFIVPGLGKDLGWQEEGVGSEAVNKGFEPSRHHVRITVKY